MTAIVEMEDVWFSYPAGRRRLSWFDRSRWAGEVRPAPWAIAGVGVRVEAGECLAVMGRNGSGKTTLLRVMAGVFAPMRGRSSVRGRVVPILRTGGLLRPELTARSNIRVLGSVFGLPRGQVERALPAIAAFAELEGELDRRVEEFSTGMAARLTFALLAQMEADVLILDEALSAGDGPFRRKCRDLMRERVEGGAGVVFVSHEATLVRDLCDRAIFLEKGRLVAEGDPGELLKRLETEPPPAPAPGGTP